MVRPNIKDLYESFGNEIIAKKNRVRNIIGDANWGEEGRYKEKILKDIIQRYLPDDLSIGTGFVAFNNKNIITSTTQIDLIIYQNTYPPILKEDNFIILHPDPVYAIIEVKTCIDNNKDELMKILNKSTENGIKIIRNKRKTNNPIHFFNGIFSYDSKMKYKEILPLFKDHWDTTVNLKISDEDPFIEKGWKTHGITNYFCLNPDIYFHSFNHKYRAYRKKLQAPAYFLSMLMECLKFYELFGSDDWFAFPRGDAEEIDSIRIIGKEDSKK